MDYSSNTLQSGLSFKGIKIHSPDISFCWSSYISLVTIVCLPLPPHNSCCHYFIHTVDHFQTSIWVPPWSSTASHFNVPLISSGTHFFPLTLPFYLGPGEPWLTLPAWSLEFNFRSTELQRAFSQVPHHSWGIPTQTVSPWDPGCWHQPAPPGVGKEWALTMQVKGRLDIKMNEGIKAAHQQNSQLLLLCLFLEQDSTPGNASHLSINLIIQAKITRFFPIFSFFFFLLVELVWNKQPCMLKKLGTFPWDFKRHSFSFWNIPKALGEVHLSLTWCWGSKCRSSPTQARKIQTAGFSDCLQFNQQSYPTNLIPIEPASGSSPRLGAPKRDLSLLK